MSAERRVAVSGCGAVTELYYAPALRSLERRGLVRVVGFFDPDAEALARVARSFSGAARVATYEALVETSPDLVVVASPPSRHATQVISALEAGAAVFCEKPIALGCAEARTLARAASSASRLLAVGMVRRHFPAARLVKELLARDVIGAPLAFSYFEGGPFRWPVRSPSYFDRTQSGGGVLVDIGSHVLDLLGWWLGATALCSASDDAMGGVEANALLELECANGVDGTVRLSRDWRRPNELRLRGERGTIRWQLDRLAGIEVEHADGRRERIVDPRRSEVDFLDCFTAQLETVLGRLDDASTEVVEASDLLPIVELIEQAYAARSPMPMPWMSSSGGR